jgi:hypothetical protein
MKLTHGFGMEAKRRVKQMVKQEFETFDETDRGKMKRKQP